MKDCDLGIAGLWVGVLNPYQRRVAGLPDRQIAGLRDCDWQIGDSRSRLRVGIAVPETADREWQD